MRQAGKTPAAIASPVRKAKIRLMMSLPGIDL
jgi:hypothetical protein